MAPSVVAIAIQSARAVDETAARSVCTRQLSRPRVARTVMVRVRMWSFTEQIRGYIERVKDGEFDRTRCSFSRYQPFVF